MIPHLLLAVVLAFLQASARAEDESAWQEAQDQAAEQSFDSIMQQNAYEAPARADAIATDLPAGAAASPPVPGPSALGPAAPGPAAPVGGPAGEVELPLREYEAMRSRSQALSAGQQAALAPLVVLGGSSFSGRAIDGALSLDLDLHVTLGQTPDGGPAWKVVPLVGEEVVVVSARAGGQTIPLSRMSGYHVWITQETGERSLELSLLVPSQGRRGSLEYDFKIAKTPATRFSCSFPSAGLEPRLRGAVQAEVSAISEGTLLSASLEPTSRVHLVGFKDLGTSDEREARLYAEGLNLVSLSDGTLELFSVLRYNILYAGNRRFDIQIPRGMTVVSADGEGAFRYTLEPDDQGTLLRGETAYPIRNGYEISLRLKREIAGSAEPFTVELPRTVGVEREYGWVGVEVTGNLKLEEVERKETIAVDVRQLPLEMVQSAVSPLLKAYRYHAGDARLVLSAQDLPEQDPASASIDTIVADTVVSMEGRRLTDVRITLRNRLRHSLRVRLPEGATVRSTLLDGQPIKPSLATDGALLFPLKRSEDAHGLTPFTLQLVVEEDGDAPGVFGRMELSLPAVELPVSSLQWTAWLPRNNDYSRLEGDVEPQSIHRTGQWYQAPVPSSGFLLSAGEADQRQQSNRSGGDAGAMPVRIDLPRAGTGLSYNRYWIEADQPVRVTSWHLRSWLKGPLGLALLAGLVLSLGLLGPRYVLAESDERRRLGLLGAGAIGLSGLGLAFVGGGGWVVVGGALGLAVLLRRTGLLGQLRPAFGAWSAGLRAPAPADGSPDGWKSRHPLSKLLLAMAWSLVVLLGSIALLRLLFLLPDPYIG